MLEIEKNIPVPKLIVRNTYPYKELEVGESFFVEGVGNRTMLNSNYTNGKKLNRKFILRREGNGCRIWRIE